MEQGKWVEVLDWLERLLTRFLLSFGLGYLVGQNKKREVEAENEKLKLEIKGKDAEQNVEKKYSGSSDLDVVKDAIKSGQPNKPGSKT